MVVVVYLVFDLIMVLIVVVLLVGAVAVGLVVL